MNTIDKRTTSFICLYGINIILIYALYFVNDIIAFFLFPLQFIILIIYSVVIPKTIEKYKDKQQKTRLFSSDYTSFSWPLTLICTLLAIVFIVAIILLTIKNYPGLSFVSIFFAFIFFIPIILKTKILRFFLKEFIRKEE